MEETAYFLDLTVKCDKPVVMVGAMRPSTSSSADGPFNLYNAVVTAADKASANRGVLVVMNDTVLDGRDVTKTNTTDVATFKSVNYGPLGYIHNGKIDYQRTPARKHTSDTPFDVSKLNELPKVGIVYNYANASDLPAKALVDAGYDASSALVWVTVTCINPCSTLWRPPRKTALQSCVLPRTDGRYHSGC